MKRTAESPLPSMQAVKSAIAWGALGATFPAMTFGPFYFILLPIALAIALSHVMVLGLPIYLLLRRRFALSRTGATMAGFLIGALPVTILSVLTNPLLERPGHFGWVPLLFGVCGGVGGFMFGRTLDRAMA